MFESRVPEEFGMHVRSLYDDQTFRLLAQVSERLQAHGFAEISPEDLAPGDPEFEIACQIGLAAAIRRHRPGKPVTGAGGSPVVDGTLYSNFYRGEAKDALERAHFRATWRDVRTFLKKLLSPLILWVMDLPASETHHHPYPYGLIDHSFEVALAVHAECGPRLMPEACRSTTAPLHYDQPLLLSLVLSFVHDIGKVFNVEVKDRKTCKTWDPMREPLAYFKARHGLPILEPTPFHFLPGRGLNGHERKGQELLPLVIHPRIWKRMGPEILSAYEAYTGRYETATPARPAPLDFIADCVHRADGTSAARSHARGSKPGDYLLELVANNPREA